MGNSQIGRRCGIDEDAIRMLKKVLRNITMSLVEKRKEKVMNY